MCGNATKIVQNRTLLPPQRSGPCLDREALNWVFSVALPSRVPAPGGVLTAFWMHIIRFFRNESITRRGAMALVGRAVRVLDRRSSKVWHRSWSHFGQSSEPCFFPCVTTRWRSYQGKHNLI